MQRVFEIKDHPLGIVYRGNDKELLQQLSQSFTVNHIDILSDLESYLKEQNLLTLPECILIEVDSQGECFKTVERIKKNALLKGLIIILLSPVKNSEWRLKAMQLKVHDFYTEPYPVSELIERIKFLVRFKLITPSLSELSKQVDVTYKMPRSKRTFDILVSGIALLLLSPILLLVAMIIRLESKGNVIYKSKRVGTGYHIFDFFKFRSMNADADKQIGKLADLNQYEGEKGKAVFVKYKDDPRVTKFGKFIRSTSIDELPQLYNVFRGDMSIVGNRPLPLYEAEMLTSNEWSGRFNGPAGLTGLWQISKRGKADMSERERKKLDNFYVAKYSFWFDLKILLGTFPALLQKEKV